MHAVPAANTDPAPGPDPRRLAALLVRAWFEVRAGDRPRGQLEPLLAPVLRRRLVSGLQSRRDRPGPRVRRVVGHWPRHDAYEGTVLVARGDRLTAVAVRLERHRGRWRAVELASPEAGYAPLKTASLPPGHRPRDAFDEIAAADTVQAPTQSDTAAQAPAADDPAREGAPAHDAAAQPA